MKQAEEEEEQMKDEMGRGGKRKMAHNLCAQEQGGCPRHQLDS